MRLGTVWRQRRCVAARVRAEGTVKGLCMRASYPRQFGRGVATEDGCVHGGS